MNITPRYGRHYTAAWNYTIKP